jgi:hypothetical protein
MWLYLIAVVLILAGIIGGALTGGIFTIILLPIGAVMLIVAAATGLFARASANRAVSAEPDDPLPRSRPTGTGRVATTPERLADARRAQQ